MNPTQRNSAMTNDQKPPYCPGCGAPAGYPPAGPCLGHGKPGATATNARL